MDLMFQRFKTIDCKLLHSLFEDLKRFKMMRKVIDGQIIFLKSVQSSQKLARNKKKKGLEISHIDLDESPLFKQHALRLAHKR